ncbi:uncharacterized protein LOC133184447 [Saccostrea echinata]|uniref:uncharacterized protein LOC133184447 n=1 Tax=Saccostrea echinata TaxID=191078 RepID=UPI002A83C610|nr:uncharacterized protein LOC133184447 [Saccostrea echinata]
MGTSMCKNKDRLHKNPNQSGPSDPNNGILLAINCRKVPSPEASNQTTQNTEKEKISIARLYEKRYTPAFSGMTTAYSDLLKKKPSPRAPAKIDVGFVFKVRESAININPFVEVESSSRLKERTISVMDNDPDLLNVFRVFRRGKRTGKG